ncbi:hypothetical protein GBAR_LOCUS362 [Geodia barretti]|uniref:Uncharacterized protein n=1 Tax=Geodia barretti TaxID=519541 RepID=A0AA35QT37_GEOBA|nr:hypothetical protein GBAR_LOCUS362 [Geodia barretti]
MLEVYVQLCGQKRSITQWTCSSFFHHESSFLREMFATT